MSDVIHMRLTDALRDEACCTYARHLSRGTGRSRMHDHDYYELFWVEQGPGIHHIEGEDREVEVGTIQLIQPQDRHTFRALPDVPFAWTNVAFPVAIWRELKRRYFGNSDGLFAPRAWQAREFIGLEGLIGDLRSAASRLNAGRRDRLALDAFLLQTLSLLDASREPTDSAPIWLQSLREALRQQENFLAGVTAVVARTGRCHAHVCREYQRHFEVTPTQEMSDARMRYAARQLRATDLSILEIAFDTGLSNLGYFYRKFQEKQGCSPAVYRRAGAGPG